MNTKKTAPIKNILIVCATSNELKTIKNLYTSQPSSSMKADFLLSGIGNIETSISLTQKIGEKKYDFILNIGVCGYKKEKQNIIQIARSVYAATKKEILTPVFFEFAKLEAIYCSDIAVYDSDDLGDENYVDMESYAIEKVCEYFKIPRLILKVPIDKIGLETKNFDYASACKTLGENIDMLSLLGKIEAYLSSLPEEKNIDTYFEHYGFTVSEKIIFEKYYHKYITLSEKNFDSFFTENKGESKKDFLKKLEETNIQLSKI